MHKLDVLQELIDESVTEIIVESSDPYFLWNVEEN